MKYIEECIDTTSEYGQKYLALVAKNDTVSATHTHHIVPVAYYKDVLGITKCRASNSIDMDASNLVKLSVGKHLLAHYYLMKCARPCIKAQMTNAFMCTYKTTDTKSITEDEVIARMHELDSMYAKLKNGKRPHKDGIVISNGKNTHRLSNWVGGEKSGPYVVYDNANFIQELGIYNSAVRVHFTYFGNLDEHDQKHITGCHPNGYQLDEIVGIGITTSHGVISITPTTFSIYENPVMEHLIQIYPHYHWDDSYQYTYSFRTPYGDSPVGGVDMNDMDTIREWVNKSQFSQETYQSIAFIMDFIGKSDKCWHIYQNMCNDYILRALSYRASKHANDLINIFSTINNYIKAHALPTNLQPILHQPKSLLLNEKIQSDNIDKLSGIICSECVNDEVSTNLHTTLTHHETTQQNLSFWQRIRNIFIKAA